MVYECEIHFTLDTICPWTYLAKRRLESALRQLPNSSPSSPSSPPPVTFTLKFLPHQLYPEASQSGEDKYTWYRRSRYGDSDEKWRAYTQLMAAYGATEGINYRFTGTMANTLQAHRMIQHFQTSKGPETANALVNSLYRQFFEEGAHPSSRETLGTAMREAGVGETEAEEFLADEEEGIAEVKGLIREQKGNGIDAVPHMVFVGRKRDVTVVGCQEGKDYLKALNTIIRDCK